MADYLNTALLCKGKFYTFFESARSLNVKYVFLHFMLLFGLLALPVFYVLVNTQPHEMYQRVFSMAFEDARILIHDGVLFSPEHITEEVDPAIYVFDDVLVFYSSHLSLYAPAIFFDTVVMPFNFEGLFDVIAMYNRYITELFMPMVLLVTFIMLVLNLFFFIVTAVFLGMFRTASSIMFTFGERFKMAVMSSLPAAVLCMVVAFFAPIVHIVLFQAINLMVVFWISKQYDLREKEMLGVM